MSRDAMFPMNMRFSDLPRNLNDSSPISNERFPLIHTRSLRWGRWTMEHLYNTSAHRRFQLRAVPRDFDFSIRAVGGKAWSAQRASRHVNGSLTSMDCVTRGSGRTEGARSTPIRWQTVVPSSGCPQTLLLPSPVNPFVHHPSFQLPRKSCLSPSRR